jgi:hypothetical protein
MIGPLGAFALAFLAGGPLALAQNTQPAAAPAPAQATTPEQKLYKSEQLDQMLAPVALYPDSVLSQLLMASTYPSDVAEAAAWSAKHKDAKGDAAVNQVENEPWDPSVKSLVAFPQMLEQLAKQPDWVQKTGDAFLAQPEDVMASIQRLRTQAQKAGNLKSNEQQNVIVKEVPVQSEPASTSTTNTTIIQIEPSNPETVYVPAYNPTTVYGTWAYPSYPPPYWPPSPYYYPGYYPGAALATGIMWGIGIAAIGSCWGGFGWGHGDVNINVNKYNNINRNNQINGGGNQNWKHNAQNRRGTPYADNRSRQQYGQGVGGANNRANYRGNDASRQRAQQSFNNSTGYKGATDRAGNTGSGNRANAGAGNRANAGGAANRANTGANAGNRGSGNMGSSAGNRSANSGSRSNSSNAFSGSRSPQSSQNQASRGQSSQRSMSSGGSRGGGSQVSRSAPSRGGGGGRGRR